MSKKKKNNKKKCPKFCCNCEHWEIMYKEKEWEEKGELACGSCHRYPPNIPSVFIGNVKVSNLYGSEYAIRDVLQFEDPIKGGMCVGYPVTFAFDYCDEFSKIKKPRYSWKEYMHDENCYTLTEKGQAVLEEMNNGK